MRFSKISRNGMSEADDKMLYEQQDLRQSAAHKFELKQDLQTDISMRISALCKSKKHPYYYTTC